MDGNQKRLDLVQRAAEKLGGGQSASPIDRAAQQVVGHAPTRTAAATQTVALDLPPDPAPDLARAAAGAERQTQNYIKIDLVKLQLAGLVTPHCEPVRIAEEFRILKRPLLIKAFSEGKAKHPNGHLIMVTSAQPGEGKTFTTFNLAMSIASEPDLNVLLIDSDVHKPGIMEWLGIETEKGLVDLLADKRLDLTDVLIRTNIPNLTVLPSGTSYPQATELLASQRMVELVRDIASRYPDRVIIFDTPPVLASSEPGVLALHVGQIVFVVEACRTSQRAVEEALPLVSACQSISFVLNRVGPRIGSNRFGSYSYYEYAKQG